MDAEKLSPHPEVQMPRARPDPSPLHLGGAVAVLVITTGRPWQQGPHVRSGPVPEPDGERVILYDVAVLEDDSDCGARTPYKHSTEELVVEWHTARDVTLYTRGGLYQTDVTLDDHGHYAYSGAGGPCLPRSHVDGWITKERGAGTGTCIKRECTVLIHTSALKRPPDAGVPPDGGPDDAGPADAGPP